MSYEAWGDPDDNPFEAAIEAGWINPVDQTKALIDVMNERDRQWTAEGFDPSHDDQHTGGELAKAASCYIIAAVTGVFYPLQWPWARHWWKAGDSRRMLIKAAALILAEIERLDRAAAKNEAGR